MTSTGIDANPWMLCATLLAARWALTGIAWIWLLPEIRQPRIARVFATIAASTLLGFTMTQLWAMLLAEAGHFTVTTDWGGVGILIGAGILLGWRKPGYRDGMRVALATIPVIWLLSAAIMLIPRQGEWLVGGWDPGTYVVQGCWVNRIGTFHPQPDMIFSALQPEEVPLFAPQVFNHTEGFPGFPIDPQTRSFVPFFFRFMPSVTAVLDRCGGLRAATRVNLWAGALAGAALLLCFAIVLRDRFTARVAGVIVLLHPVWLYHLRFPTTELLQQALFFSTVSLAAVRRDKPSTRWLMAVLLFALISLHISMALFASLLIAALAWVDLDDTDRRMVLRTRVCQAAGISAGVAYNAMVTPVTVERLGGIMIPLLGLSVLLIAAAIVMDVAGSTPRGRRAAAWCGRAAIMGLLAAGAVAAVLAVVGRPARFGAVRNTLRAIIPYLSPALMAAAIPGLAALRKSAPTSRVGRALLFVLLAATGMTLWQSAIVPIYPWATRRYVTFTIPLLALLASESLALLKSWNPSRSHGKCLALIALGLLLLLPAGRIRRVLTLTEYDGFSHQLAAVAPHVRRCHVIIADRFRYGIPLRFLYGRAVLDGEPLRALSGPDDIRNAAAILKRLNDTGWTIRFLTSTEEGMAVFPFRLQDVRTDWQSEPFTLRELQHDFHIRDYAAITMDRQFALHTWHPVDDDWLDESPIQQRSGDIDIGSMDDAWFVVAGFHNREQTDDGTVNVRWTEARAIIALPRPHANQGMRVTLDYIDRHRPPWAEGESVTLDLNGQPLVTELADSGHAKRLTARIPSSYLDAVENPRLGINAPAWSPVAVTRGTDHRELGIMVDRIQFAPLMEAFE